MGQPVHIVLFHESEDAGYAAAASALAELRRVEARLSRFDSASDLSELNRRAGVRPLDAGPDLYAVMAAALEYHHATRGAFNVAVEPLMRVWGFRDSRSAAPAGTELREAEEAVRHAVIRLDGNLLSLPNAHTQIDLAGIGVGYGLDRAAGVLRSAGVTSAYIDVSGDCVALGAPPGEAGWTVDIADSEHPGRIIGSTTLRDQALATSANTVSTVRYDGVIRGHVMDPATGYPAKRLRQATVVTRTGLEADVLSKTMLVRGVRPVGVERAWVA
jgi:thiamine biosynthesis lipoprotein